MTKEEALLNISLVIEDCYSAKDLLNEEGFLPWDSDTFESMGSLLEEIKNYIQGF